MDIYCKHCGEPWDVYELHDMLDDQGELLSFENARRAFYELGCGAWQNPGSKCANAPICGADRLEGISELQELLGEDVDGLASMSEDVLPLTDPDAGSDDWRDRYPVLGAFARERDK